MTNKLGLLNNKFNRGVMNGESMSDHVAELES